MYYWFINMYLRDENLTIFDIYCYLYALCLGFRCPFFMNLYSIFHLILCKVCKNRVILIRIEF